MPVIDETKDIPRFSVKNRPKNAPRKVLQNLDKAPLDTHTVPRIDTSTPRKSVMKKPWPGGSNGVMRSSKPDYDDLMKNFGKQMGQLEREF